MAVASASLAGYDGSAGFLIDRTDASRPIPVTEGALADRRFTVLGPIDVAVKKLTLFNKDPTKEQANDALIERARALGGDAVINVRYTNGIGLTTWGCLDAKGTCVKFADSR